MYVLIFTEDWLFDVHYCINKKSRNHNCDTFFLFLRALSLTLPWTNTKVTLFVILSRKYYQCRNTKKNHIITIKVDFRSTWMTCDQHCINLKKNLSFSEPSVPKSLFQKIIACFTQPNIICMPPDVKVIQEGGEILRISVNKGNLKNIDCYYKSFCNNTYAHQSLYLNTIFVSISQIKKMF